MTQMAARTYSESPGRWHLVGERDRPWTRASACGRYRLDTPDVDPPNQHIAAENVNPDQRCAWCTGWPKWSGEDES